MVSKRVTGSQTISNEIKTQMARAVNKKEIIVHPFFLIEKETFYIGYFLVSLIKYEQ